MKPHILLLALLSLSCVLTSPLDATFTRESSSWSIINFFKQLSSRRKGTPSPANADVPTTTSLSVQRGLLTICTWNIFRFGPAKFSTPDPLITAGKGVSRLDIIVDQLSECDIAAIQEYMDVGGTVIETLRRELSERTGKRFQFVISPRVGNNPYEQYVFLYRDDTVEAVRSELYPDSAHELFVREPFFTEFRMKNRSGGLSRLVLGTIHTAPEQAVSEIDHLTKSFDWASKTFKTQDVMVIGDYNAGCSYVRSKDWASISLWTEKRFKWITGNDLDTTSMTTHCAYDRAVYLGENTGRNYVEGSVRVLNFREKFDLTPQQAKLVSDHLLVRMDFN